MKNLKKEALNSRKGITLIALVITIIILLILARNKYFDIIWKERNITTSRKCRNPKRYIRRKRNN